MFFEGLRANDALAEHLLDNGLLVPGDLGLVDPALLETEGRTP
ncbi:MAG: hypothetical protein ACRD0O_15055 [Acidimicrobiia bacterium]